MPERTYSDSEALERLKAELPHWSLRDGELRRVYKTYSWKSTLMLATTIGHLAEAAWHHPDIHASYSRVEVRLSTHSAKRITDKDFALAAKIEAVVQWQPGAEGGPLEGTPKEPRFAHVKYDSPGAGSGGKGPG